MRIEENFNLRKYNTFDMDVRCKYFVEVPEEEELMGFAAEYELKPEEILILGGGSNFLFTENFEGTVIYPLMSGIEVIGEKEDKVRVRVGAGVVWDDFVAWAVGQGLGGVENLSWIPGHVGAAPVQNIGAYGMEAGDSILQVEAVDLGKAGKVVLEASDCCFSYRNSNFKKEWKNKYVVTYVVFELSKRPVFKLDYGSIRNELQHLGEELNLQNVREAVIRIRKSKLPEVSEWPNAGSFFKNPVVSAKIAGYLKEKYPEMPVYPLENGDVKLAAGWLIEQAGWKGKSMGRAGVFGKQALVLVNTGGATGIEVSRLANAIKKSVFMEFDVWIEPEVNIL